MTLENMHAITQSTKLRYEEGSEAVNGEEAAWTSA